MRGYRITVEIIIGNPWPAAACDAQNYRPHFYDCQKTSRMTRKRDREINRNTSWNGTHWGPSDPSVGIKNYCGDYTVEPVACDRMLCVQLWAVLL